MAVPESPISPALERNVAENLSKLVYATQSAAVATLAAAIVTARGKPTSIKEVLEIAHDLHFTMYPPGAGGAYNEWVKTKDARLAKVYG